MIILGNKASVVLLDENRPPKLTMTWRQFIEIRRAALGREPIVLRNPFTREIFWVE